MSDLPSREHRSGSTSSALPWMKITGFGLSAPTAMAPAVWLLRAATATTRGLIAPALITTAPPKECPTSTIRLLPRLSRYPCPTRTSDTHASRSLGRR